MTTPLDALMSEMPRYETTLPLSGKKVTFRPFLTREEKILIIAADSQEEAQYQIAADQVIFNTTFGEVQPDELESVDMDWLLVQLRKKSKGAEVEMTYICDAQVDGQKEACSQSITTHVHLDNVRYVASSMDPTIRLSDTIGVKMYPAQPSKHEDTIAGKIAHIADTIEMIYSGEEVWYPKDLSSEEIRAFVEHLDDEQMTKVISYVDTIPHIELDVHLECPKCGNKDDITLHGFESFFE